MVVNKYYTKKDFCRDLGVSERYFGDPSRNAYDLNRTGGFVTGGKNIRKSGLVKKIKFQ